MKSVNANKLNRKSGEAEGSAVLPPAKLLRRMKALKTAAGQRSGEPALREVKGDLRFSPLSYGSWGRVRVGF